MLHDDKRSFRRVSLDAPATINIPGQDAPLTAVVKDLSAGGALLWVDSEVPVDTELELTVTPSNPITPSMTAKVKVVRCSPRDDGGEGFALACQMQEVVW